jgi:sec-independent protein translocase protein TatA
MPSLGPAEILVILVVALLVFGPDKMPEIGRQVARGVREFRRIQQHVSSELHGAISELDLGPNDPPTQGDPAPTLPPKPAPSAPEVVEVAEPDVAEPAADIAEPAPNGHAPTPPVVEPRGSSEPAASPPAEPA